MTDRCHSPNKCNYHGNGFTAALGIDEVSDAGHIHNNTDRGCVQTRAQRDLLPWVPPGLDAHREPLYVSVQKRVRFRAKACSRSRKLIIFRIANDHFQVF